MQKRIIVSVSNDMSTDQRVDKVCRSLLSAGYQVKVLCRQLPDSMPIERPYPVQRMRHWFNRGPLFYAELNIRLFFKLIRNEADIFLANDLDTLLANYLAYANKKSAALVYDSHEYFTEVPELAGRRAREVWLAIERFVFPKLKHAYTVNQPIADIYSQAYKVPVDVIRNLPDTRKIGAKSSRDELGLPAQKHILILQGAGINVDRGAEEAVLAMELLSDKYLLLIIGAGDVIADLKKSVTTRNLETKVQFKDRMPYEQLMQYTCSADIAFSLDKPGSGNYDLALPNKIFDALAAGTPVVVGPTKVLAELVNSFRIGEVLLEVSPQAIAEAVKKMLSDAEQLQSYIENAKQASEKLNWQHEEKELLRIFAGIK